MIVGLRDFDVGDLWLPALAAVAFALTVVRGFIRLDDDLDNPEGGFSGRQWAGRSGACDP
ncbi:hypothetical protein EJ357_21645 [Streptomyces cyaneochromogenes]|uniref:Uncharacterized protein n=1 Tax=Streptomyces cyaneochromogenes TaxID=2496836 RepID=A0A3Q9ENZ4_9ACTN|nr:hypothetical protein [Streptomyces cyaneochromogenes]AZQ35780.1 hypothetical protein EJ357_21645 [Streptomyces cyaneochromogenes]